MVKTYQKLLAMGIFLIVLCSGNAAFAATNQVGGLSNVGFFHDYLIEPFSALLKGVAGLFHGEYGLSIILVTIIVRMVVLPLFVNQFKKQRVFQEKMAAIKPQVDSIQAKLKKTKDPEKQKELQMEMMKLYQENNINPLAMGCLPMLIQSPIMIGLYYAIRSTPEIASHSFLWFSLGQSDILMSLSAGIMYFVQAYIAQKLSAKYSAVPQNPAAQQSTKLMVFIFPVMMTIFSLNVPAALPLYWFTSGLFLTVQNIVLQMSHHKSKKSAALTEPVK
ncbi:MULTISPECIES: membrane protein insertase YidC [Bacillus]|uniref:membrane protein insertase YidC n=1 Tax=Bacillus TaxID=1386 RepID=UPI000CDB244F|nr:MULTISPECIES: membrane protein insertase YidC [Bacillus]POO80149.1 membrane protein insertase YidC [Bacillus sp. MBGLi97]AUZ39271.1 membrane protein insertase YidC [Bacillus sp. MBGLi79]MCM2583257.1 membrane protein insertase YidC [Bacillus stercoris]MDZ5670186.1 membrane protein insertase YidC [Bacillus stercoris]WGE40747.1 membrane protein insertase YidC [Bacillus stercoris]